MVLLAKSLEMKDMVCLSGIDVIVYYFPFFLTFKEELPFVELLLLAFLINLV